MCCVLATCFIIAYLIKDPVVSRDEEEARWALLLHLVTQGFHWLK